LAFAAISLSGFGGVLAWARRIMVERRRWFTAEEFNKAFALCAFLPGGNMVNFAAIFGSRIRGPLGALAALAGLLGPPMILIIAVGALYAHYGDLPSLRRIVQSAIQESGCDRAADRGRDLCRDRHSALAAAAGSACHRAGEHRRGFSQHQGAPMKSESGSLVTLAAFFAVTSLFAVGGGNSVIPEMHRYAVDVQHWLSDRQFADSSALAQLTPEPNLIIVTLIGYHVAGIAGAVVATLAMCGPISVLAFIVGRASERLTGAAWHGALTRGLVR
jgi:chromate transport protein ChrA